MSTEKHEAFADARSSASLSRRKGGMELGPYAEAVPNFAGQTALIMGHTTNELRQIGIWVDHFGGMNVATHEPATALRWLAKRPANGTLIIFHADDFDDANDVVTFGFALRRISPDAPIVMLSSQVRRNDFTSERMMICDATLKTPLTLTGFCMGVEAATRNHAYYLTATRPVANG